MGVRVRLQCGSVALLLGGEVAAAVTLNYRIGDRPSAVARGKPSAWLPEPTAGPLPRALPRGQDISA